MPNKEKSDKDYVKGLVEEGEKNAAKIRNSPHASAADLTVKKIHDTWFIDWHTNRGVELQCELEKAKGFSGAPWHPYSTYSEYPVEPVNLARERGLVIWNDLPIWKRFLRSIGLKAP